MRRPDELARLEILISHHFDLSPTRDVRSDNPNGDDSLSMHLFQVRASRPALRDVAHAFDVDLLTLERGVERRFQQAAEKLFSAGRNQTKLCSVRRAVDSTPEKLAKLDVELFRFHRDRLFTN